MNVFQLCELWIELALHRAAGFIKRILRVEIGTLGFAAIFLLIALAVGAVVRYVPQWTFAHPPKIKPIELSNVFEYVVTVLNFMGVMFISRGVILLRVDEDALKQAVANPVNFPTEMLKAIVKSSKACEIGCLFVSAALVFDVVAKAIS